MHWRNRREDLGSGIKFWMPKEEYIYFTLGPQYKPLLGYKVRPLSSPITVWKIVVNIALLSVETSHCTKTVWSRVVRCAPRAIFYQFHNIYCPHKMRMFFVRFFITSFYCQRQNLFMIGHLAPTFVGSVNNLFLMLPWIESKTFLQISPTKVLAMSSKSFSNKYVNILKLSSMKWKAEKHWRVVWDHEPIIIAMLGSIVTRDVQLILVIAN